MKETTIAVLIFVGILALLGLYEIAVWRECLQTNSWWYCMRVLSK